jgi:hypothetical protein
MHRKLVPQLRLSRGACIVGLCDTLPHTRERGPNNLSPITANGGFMFRGLFLSLFIICSGMVVLPLLMVWALEGDVWVETLRTMMPMF